MTEIMLCKNRREKAKKDDMERFFMFSAFVIFNERWMRVNRKMTNTWMTQTRKLI